MLIKQSYENTENLRGYKETDRLEDLTLQFFKSC